MKINHNFYPLPNLSNSPNTSSILRAQLAAVLNHREHTAFLQATQNKYLDLGLQSGKLIK